MIQPTPEQKIGTEPLTFRGAANGIWNKLNLALSLIGHPKQEEQLREMMIEARSLADAIVKHRQSDLPNTVRCIVKFAHTRELNGQLCMLEPMLSGILTLPYDDDTQAALERNWLEIYND